MYPILGQCPVCHEPLTVTRLHCRNCDTVVEGHFDLGRLHRLSPEQFAFVEVFLRNEGKINRVQDELGLSYPTVRGRLLDVIRAMGYEVGEEQVGMSEEERKSILADLASGKITTQAAVEMLKGS
jgi:hypothetical protein